MHSESHTFSRKLRVEYFVCHFILGIVVCSQGFVHWKLGPQVGNLRGDGTFKMKRLMNSSYFS